MFTTLLPLATSTPAEKPSEKTTQETTQKTTQKTEERILEILRRQPEMSRRQLSLELGDITEDGVKYHLDKLKKQKMIRRVGPAKGGYWEVIDHE